MVQTDKEIEKKINMLYRKSADEKNRKILLKILYNCSIIVFFIKILLISKALSCYIDNTTLLVICILIFAFLEGIITNLCIEHINLLIKETDNNKHSTEIEIEHLKNFLAYIMAHRKMESVKNGKDIYPEIRYSDSEYVIKEFKEIYEDKRKQYEKNHTSIYYFDFK